MLAKRVTTKPTLKLKFSSEIVTFPVCLLDIFKSKPDYLHLLSAFALACLLVFVPPSRFQTWHHFLSSRPKVAKQLHFCQLSEKIFLHWLLLSLTLSYPPVINVMFMKDACCVCMAAHASVWTTVHLHWKTRCGRSRGSTRRLQNLWQILLKLIKGMSPFYFYTVESLQAWKVK